MKQLTLLFLVKDSQVLLAMKKRGFGEGRWNGVGGKLEPGETIEQGLIRESQEEISVTPIDYKKVADITFFEHHGGEPVEMQVSVFIANKWNGEPSESEEMKPQWFDINNLPLKEMWPDDEHWLPQVLAGQKIDAKFWLNENDEITKKIVNQIQ